MAYHTVILLVVKAHRSKEVRGEVCGLSLCVCVWVGGREEEDDYKFLCLCFAGFL
jgi:hypothetical protein